MAATSPDSDRPDPAQRVVLLDIDGTLIASNDAHARAWVASLAEFGYVVSFERVRPLIGMGGDKLLPELVGLDPESTEAQRMSEFRGELFRSRELPHLEATPGARDLLLRFRADGTGCPSPPRPARPMCRRRSSRPAWATSSRPPPPPTTPNAPSPTPISSGPRCGAPGALRHTQSCWATRHTTSRLPRERVSASSRYAVADGGATRRSVAPLPSTMIPPRCSPATMIPSLAKVPDNRRR